MKNNCLIKSNIALKRPLVFLCGSYYIESSKTDKRNILIESIKEHFHDDVFPLIVDTFLDIDNLEISSYSIEQYEELISNISFLNIVFLESFSSASELGLFSNNSSATHNIVFYPESANLILDKTGYFIKNGVFTNRDKIEAVSYSAYVERFAHGTDYIDEHYYFLNNKLPKELEAVVARSLEKVVKKKFEMSIVYKDNPPADLTFFSFSISRALRKIYLSIQTCFYLLYPLLLEDYSFNDILSLDVDKIFQNYSKSIKEIIVNSLLYNGSIESIDYDVEILKYQSVEEFVRYSTYFIKYMTIAMFEKKKIKKKQLVLFSDIFEEGPTYSEKESAMISIPASLNSIKKTELIKRFKLFKAKKVRTITTYKEGNNVLNNIHKHLNAEFKKICNKYNLYSDFSYAYKSGFNSLMCVSKHCSSRAFLKADIRNFFETMKPNIVVDRLIEVFKNDKYYKLFNTTEENRFKNRLNKAISILTIRNKFLVGFITSPIISEIYLSSFDKEMNTFCHLYNCIYTRYADDILISSNSTFDKTIFINKMTELLSELSLELNKGKICYKEIKKDGDYIRFIGLNLAQSKGIIGISVGRTFVKRLAKLKAYGPNDDYTKKKIKGLESYLKYNDKVGYNKYLKLVDSYNS